MSRSTRHSETTRRRVLRTTGLAAGTLAFGGLATGTVAADAADAPAIPGRVYADDRLFATKDATDLPPPSDGNEDSFDEIYVFTNGVEGQFGVAEAAPGERDFNGGRWSVTVVEWNDGASKELLTSDDAVHARSDDITVQQEGARYFECPLVPLKG